ncbi:TraL conjugative transposon family protein [Bacteroides uniformis]|uniref:TraL conjugative transposon family protein n=1 Tax=Bacteroides uniformis TaxID=820 RepID=UPI00319E3637
MKKRILKIRGLAEGKLRDFCDSLTPEMRKAVVIGLCAVFMAVNFYMIFRAIYDIGREDARQEVIEITPLDIPDFVPADTLSDEKVRDMEEFFNQFNRQDNE